MILGTMTAIKHMSVKRGGKGGVVINVSSMAGESVYTTQHHYDDDETCCFVLYRAISHI